ncbi:hypothetical protein G6F66_015678 [Rhizopus arrhizus]|nr:hypothetical protein G6F66_015678 [Rhizopus arrhizus]
MQQGGHQLLRIQRAIGVEVLLAALAHQVHRPCIPGQALQLERDAHAVGRGAIEEAVELHAGSWKVRPCVR